MENIKAKSIYVVLSNTGSLFTRLIGLYTKDDYNHSSLAFDSEFNELYSFGRRRPENPLNGGFVVESFYTGTFAKFANTRCMILRVEVTEEKYRKMKELVSDFVEHKEDYDYNFLGIAGALFKVDVPRKHAYFCSQFVNDVFLLAGIELWDTPSYLVKPSDFYVHPHFTVMYEGLVRNYRSYFKLKKV